MKSRWLGPAFKIAMSIALLAFLFLTVDLGKLGERLASLPIWLILLAWAYYTVCQLLSAWRWQWLLQAKGIHVPILKLFNFYMIGMFLNTFIPSSLGGDAVKTIYLYRSTGQGTYSLISVFLERFTGLVGLTILSTLAVLVWGFSLNSWEVFAAVTGTNLALFGMVLLLWWPPLANLFTALLGRFLPAHFAERFRKLYDALLSYRDHRETMIKSILLSVVLQAVLAGYWCLIAWGIGIPIHIRYFLLFTPLVALISLLPISFGGWGVKELVMIWLFEQVQFPREDILAVSLIASGLNVILSLWGGGLMLVQKTEASVHVSAPVADPNPVVADVR
jgi:uncharacterized protein (TIRG00374 family)